MIRAGRLKYVQTMADLATALGKPLGTVRNTKPYEQAGHPPAISSPQARAKLWDAQQTQAYWAGESVPALPTQDDDEDLLDRNEAAAEIGVAPNTWNRYKNDPQLTDHVVRVPEPDGAEHWPRHALRAFQANRPGRAAGGGRPTGSGDMLPREEIAPRIAELLDTNAAITLTEVAENLGIAKFPTAQAGLARARGQRIADLLQDRPHLTPLKAAKHLGYPAVTHRGAITAAEDELRTRRATPYLQEVADALAQADIAQPTTIAVRHLDGGHLATALTLATGYPPALVWDERYGWRTATSRRHPIGKDTAAGAPRGEGIGYLGRGTTPTPAELLEQLADGAPGTPTPQA